MDRIKNVNRKTIKCPHCNWEYEPGEILYPEKLLGKPENVIRDTLGKIIYTEYHTERGGVEEIPVFTEEYYCDNCGRNFVIEIDLNFKTRQQDEELDFSDTSVSLF